MTEGARSVPPRRALILAGGGMRVAWQAGAVRALYEDGLTFDHGDGTSGGIFTLGMLLSGVSPMELGERWRTLDPKTSVSLLPWQRYLVPTSLPAFGDADGLVQHVFPHLGIDIERIRMSTVMTGSFNVADFTTKTCVAIPHDEIDLPRLTAGVSLPVFLPAVDAGGRTWTDAVWIKDANLLEAVRRGCTELWVLWCIGNTPEWGRGALEQYVHMIELSANSALFDELAEIASINAQRPAEEAVVVHVVKPEVPLPLDPDFLAGRITGETLVAMGYRDARRYLRGMVPGGVALDHRATAMRAAPLGCRLTVRTRGRLGTDQVELHLVVELTDLASEEASLVGWLRHPRWGPLPLASGRCRLDSGRFVGSGEVLATDGPYVLEVRLDRASGRWSTGATTRGLDLALRRADGTAVAGGRARLSRGDVVRSMLSFEPSGGHDLRDRVRALRLFRRWLQAP